MPDGQDYGWEPQQGYGPQNGQGQPWQAGQYGPGAHQQHMGGPQPPYPPPGVPWQQPGYGQPPPNPPTQVLYGPPGGPQGRKPWPARHKVLTGILAFCGLVFIIGIAAAAGSSSSSTSAAASSSLTAKAPVATPSPTVKKAATATQTVTTAPSTPVQTTPAPSTQAQTTARGSANNAVIANPHDACRTARFFSASDLLSPQQRGTLLRARRILPH